VRRDYLAYFNQVAAGPKNGYKHLVDSSLDWGQDLPALRSWLAQNPDRFGTGQRYLAYFGTALPEWYGIKATSLPCDRSAPKLAAGARNLLYQCHSTSTGLFLSTRKMDTPIRIRLSPGAGPIDR